MNKVLSTRTDEQAAPTHPQRIDITPSNPGRGGDAYWPGPVVASVRRWADGPRRTVVALRGPDGTLSYGALDQAADALASRLRLTVDCTGQVVAILTDRRPELVLALLATMRAGAVFCVIDTSYPASRIRNMLAKVGPVAVIDVGGSVDCDYDCPRFVVPGLGSEAIGDLLSIQECDAGSQPVPTPGSDDPACVTFTSGSTGVPMAVLGRQSGLSAFLPWLEQTFDLGPDDIFSMLSGLSHDPLQRDVFTAWWTGACIAVPPPDIFDLPGALVRWLAETGVTVANLTPSMLRLMALGGTTGERLPRLRRVFLVGEALRAADVLALRAIAPNAEVINLYGATETQRALVHHRIPSDMTPVDPIPLGTGCPEMEVLVLRPDGTVAEPGETGALWIKSDHLALGYLGDEEATRAAFQTDADGSRRYRTGDMGIRHTDGTVMFAGRQDRQINVRGYRVELGEIEAAAEQLATVRSARSVWVEDRGQILVFAIPADGAPMTERDVTLALGQALPGYMRPARVRFLPTFPMTPNGKLDDRALISMAIAPRRGAAAGSA